MLASFQGTDRHFDKQGMNRSPSTSPGRMAAVFFATIAMLPAAHATVSTDPVNPAAASAPDSAPALALPFDTPVDTEVFRNMCAKAYASYLPDARSVAKAFLRDQLDIDGDAYVVAHFATQQSRAKGVPDHTILLTDGLMEAFPDHSRHSFFAEASDTVGGLVGGGSASPGIVPFAKSVVQSDSASAVFANIGRFLWSRTGPGYLYNTFFAQGNVIATVGEDSRSLDDAFGIFRVGGFTADHASPLKLSQLVEKFSKPSTFAELPYVRELDDELDRYWDENRTDWYLLARYEFIHRARQARDAGELSQKQYQLVMDRGAPGVPLAGPIALSQLRGHSSTGLAEARRLDINGYAATDLVRFVASDGSEVMYIPGGKPSFVAARGEEELREWVLAQAGDPQKLDALLAHFSIYHGQDGLFWTGVKHGLQNIRTGRWQADDSTVDRADSIIDGDVFEDMRVQTERRVREDAAMHASTAWEEWRRTINRTTTLLSPLGFISPLSIPVLGSTGIAAVGTGVEQAVDGRTEDERSRGAESALSTVVNNIPVGALFATLEGGPRAPTESVAMREGEMTSFAPPRRIEGRIGYPMGPLAPSGWRVDLTNRLYRLPDGSPGLWAAADETSHMVDLPATATLRPDGMYAFGMARYVEWTTLWGRQRAPSGAERGKRVMPLLADASGTQVEFRIALKDGSAGPFVEKQGDGSWRLAFNEKNYLPGSVLTEMVQRDFTQDPRTLNRAAEVLEQFGASENKLAELRRSGFDARPAPLLLTLSLGHAFIETLSARLRDPAAIAWSPRETLFMAPLLAERGGRPLALYRSDGSLESAVAPNGVELPAEQIPADALRLQRSGDRYVLLSDQPGVLKEYPSALAAVARNSQPATAQPIAALREAEFRENLANAIDTRSMRPELDRLRRTWIEPATRSDWEIFFMRILSDFRYALFKRELTNDQKALLRSTDDALRTGENEDGPLARPALDALMAKISSPEIQLLPADLDYVGRLLARLVDEHCALLPADLDYLLVNDQTVRTYARNVRADEWTLDGRHYARIRHLDGRTQVVETGPTQPDDTRVILAPGGGPNRFAAYVLIHRDREWIVDLPPN